MFGLRISAWAISLAERQAREIFFTQGVDAQGERLIFASMSQPELNELTNLTLTAVKSLLQKLAQPTANAELLIAQGQALRDILSNEPLAMIVSKSAIDERNAVVAARKG